MIRVRNVTLFFLCLMIFLNGLFLIFTTNAFWPNGMLLFIPTIAVLLVDVYQRFHINSIVAGAIGFSMCGIAIYSMTTSGPDQQLAIVSELTTYLLVVLVFQRKSPRLYWQLAILSVLQTVVASVYSGTLQQGIAYIAYYAVILIFLSLVSIYRDQLLSDGALDPWHNLKSEHSLWFSFRKNRNKQQFVRVRQYEKQIRKMSLFGTPIAIILLTTLSVASGMGFFGAMPNRNRFTESDFLRLNSTIGVSDRIPSLETDSDPTEDSTEVLRVKFVNPKTKETMRLSGDIYIPRICLEVLGKDKTSWDPLRADKRNTRVLSKHKQLEEFNVPTVEQHFLMLPDEEPAVYGIRPWSVGRNSTELSIVQGSGSIIRSESLNSSLIKKSKFRYNLNTFGVYQNEIAPSYPFRSYSSGSLDESLSKDTTFLGNEQRINVLKQFDKNRYPTLLAEATRIKNSVEKAKLNRIEVVKKMESFLRDSPEFSYTKELTSIVRDKSLDPVEDFVKNFKTGHCQLYASALAIMLRSVEIPSRVVVGYRTNKYSEVGSYYSVERRHAHVWVEAYIPGSRFPRAAFQRGHASELAGGWYRLDATPEFSAAGFGNEDPDDVIALAQSLWDEYVEGFEPSETDTRTLWQRLKKYGRFLDLSALSVSATKLGQGIGLQGQVGIALFFVLAIFWWRMVAKREDEHRKAQVTRKKVSSPLRRFFGNIGLVSTYENQNHWANTLIQRFDQAMAKAGFQKRKNHETISEYIRSLRQSAPAGPAADAFFSHLNQLSFLIYQLRYGGAKKGDLAVREAKHMLRETTELISEMKKENGSQKAVLTG